MKNSNPIRSGSSCGLLTGGNGVTEESSGKCVRPERGIRPKHGWDEQIRNRRSKGWQLATVLCGLLLACSGMAQRSPATLPNVHFSRPGLALATAMQDDGKVIIGGYFSSVNGVTRNNIARLNADGSVDETWNPGVNNAVRQIVLSGTDAFVLGDFTFIGGQSRNGIAKVSTLGDGTADAVWNPSHPGNLHALAVSGTDLFVGGLSYLAKLSTTGSGASDSPWGPQPDYNIFVLAVRGTDLYVGGNFSRLGGYNRNRLAKVSTLGAGDVDQTWDPNVIGGNLGYIPALAVTESYLYVGGSFDTIGGMSRKNIARLSLDGTGAPDPAWNPHTDREMVYALAVNGEEVYVGGTFTQIGGLRRNGLARLSVAGNGAGDPSWNAVSDGHWITALTVSGSSVFAGGDFATINGVASLSVAKLSAVTGACDDSFSADVGYPGRALAVARQSDGKVIVGGDFGLVSGVPRQNLARFNVDGTLDNTWRPGADGPVTALAIQGTDIFVAGEFGTIGGQSRRFLAKLSATASDEADAAWNPNLSEPVDALAIESADLFVASSSWDSGTIAKLSTTGTGQSDPDWNPGRFECFFCQFFGDKPVRSLAVNATSVYVAGDFDGISRGNDYVARSGLVKLSATGTGEPDLQWNPPFAYGARALVLESGDLYVAGFSGLTRVSATGTGVTDTGWQPDLASGYVEVIAISGTNLYAAGSLSTASGLTNATLVRLSTTGSGAIDPTWNPNPHRTGYMSGCVAGLAGNGTDVYVVGDFDTIGGAARQGFAFLPVADAPVVAEGPASTVFIRRNSMDGREVTHFRITDVQGGLLHLTGSGAPIGPNDFITAEQGEAGLRFSGNGGTASVTVLSALNATPDGAGSAETSLVFTGEPTSCLLRFTLSDGLTLFGSQTRTYQIDYAESLNPPINWQPLTIVRPNRDGAVVVPGTRLSNKAWCFYRAVVLP